MRNMVAVSSTIDKIIETPTKKPSKKEAEKVLRSCGIFDKNNKIRPAYKKIITADTPDKNDNK